jgi:antitoxin CptB
MHSPSDILTASEINQLKWRCRRGLLENDLFIERFFQRYERQLQIEQAQALLRLMDFSDNDLLDLLLQRQDSNHKTLDNAMTEVLRMLRTNSTDTSTHEGIGS